MDVEKIKRLEAKIMATIKKEVEEAVQFDGYSHQDAISASLVVALTLVANAEIASKKEGFGMDHYKEVLAAAKKQNQEKNI